MDELASIVVGTLEAGEIAEVTKKGDWDEGVKNVVEMCRGWLMVGSWRPKDSMDWKDESEQKTHTLVVWPYLRQI